MVKDSKNKKKRKTIWKQIVSCMLTLFLAVGGFPVSLVPVQAASPDDEGMFGVFVGNGALGDDESNLCVDDLFASEGIYGDFAATPYWQQDSGNAGKLKPGDASNYSLYYDRNNQELHLKDLNLVVNSAADGNAIFSEIDLKLVLEGTNNQITSNGGIAVMTTGNLEIVGSGNLEVTTSAATDFPAFLVGGSITHNGTGIVALNPSGNADGICWDDNTQTTHEILGTGQWAPGSLPGTGAGRGIFIDDDTMYSDGMGDSLFYLNGDNGTIKTDGADENNYNIKYVPGNDKNKLYLKNLTLETSEWLEGLVYESEKELEIILNGTNKISSDAIAMRLGAWEDPENGQEAVVVSKVTFSGTGTLALYSDAIQEGNNEMYYPTGLVVISDIFENQTAITVYVNDNAELGAEITANAEEGKVINTGSITVSNKKILVGGTGEAEGLSYNAAMKEHTMPQTDAVIKEGAIGKCYYFYAEEYYPNEHIADVKDAPRIYGKYDENGNPIPSNIVIQTVTYDKYNVPYMDDFVEPTWWLVYEEDYEGDIDTIVTENDIVSVCDGQKHTFKTDIYRAWIEVGDVTINGNVTCDIAFFEAPRLLGERIYERDENGNILFLRNSRNTKVTIHGNVGFMSVNKSFDGNVTVDGKVDAIGIYDDVAVRDGNEPEEKAVYGPYTNGTNILVAGQLSSKSNLIGGTDFTDGNLKGYGVYEGNLYVMTEGTEGNQEVKGTCNVLDGNPAVVSVSADSITSGSAPKVEEADTKDKKKVEAVIGTGKTYTAFDLSLIENNAKAVQPVKEMDVFISNTEGYQNPVVCYVKPDGTLEQHRTQIMNGKICFQTNHLSTYVIVEAGDLKEGMTVVNTTEAGTTAQVTGTDKTNTPGTGDSHPVMWILMLLGVTSVGVICLSLRKR
ncbi:MAG: hypothetical protein J6K43_07500 [Lachnospiraceae bacterium]|nr:hypothetical protein [Lachnospiraceae bacterium]